MGNVLHTPWRTVNWSDREPMLKTLKEFQSNHGLDHLRILVVGPAGAGKSTFITSLNSVLQGRNTYLAHSLTDGSSVTCKYTVYKLNKGTDGSIFPFVFGDTMGLEEGLHGVQPNDIINILQGRMREGYTFNPMKELTAASDYYNTSPSIIDKIHCLMFVLPADIISQIADDIMNKMKQMIKKAHELGIPIVVIMPKVDVACPLVKEKLTMIYNSCAIKTKMEECSSRLGIPVKQIFPIKNYHEEISTNAEVDVLILMAVTNIVNFADDFVKDAEKPWRPVNWSEKERMLKTLKEFQKKKGVDDLRILVVGPAGAGKSAFITSVNTVLQGRNTYLAHSLSAGSRVTSKYTVYKLNKGTDGSFFPFVFGDTMGVDEGSEGVHTNDIISILQGHVREGYAFDPVKELTAESNDFNAAPTLDDKVHCLVFVLPADDIGQISDEIMTEIKDVLQKAHELGIPIVVLMSRVDVACPRVKENLTMIYRSPAIKMKMEECNRRLGVPMNYIFPVKNYHEEINNNAQTDVLILTAVTNILNFANDYVERKV